MTSRARGVTCHDTADDKIRQSGCQDRSGTRSGAVWHMLKMAHQLKEDCKSSEIAVPGLPSTGTGDVQSCHPEIARSCHTDMSCHPDCVYTRTCVCAHTRTRADDITGWTDRMTHLTTSGITCVRVWPSPGQLFHYFFSPP